MQDDGTACAEPGAQVGQSGQLVTFPRRDIGTCLQQVFTHVVAEIFEESDLLGIGEGIPQSEPVSGRTPTCSDNQVHGVGAHLLHQGVGVGTHGEVGLNTVTLYVLQAIPIIVEDEASRVIEEHPHAVVTKLIP